MKKIFIRIAAKLFKELKRCYYIQRYDQYRNHYKLPDSFRFNGEEILFYGKGNISIGENSYVGSYSTLQSVEGGQIRIGNYCSISHNVRMYTESNVSDQLFTNEQKEKKKGNIIIGNGVWIGVNVVITPGITIADNSIVGANSVVTQNIPPNAIYGGVPAKLISLKKC